MGFRRAEYLTEVAFSYEKFGLSTIIIAFHSSLVIVHDRPYSGQSVVVILILLTLVFEAGIANVPDYFLDEDKGRFDFRDGDPESVICPVNHLNLIFWPKDFQWVDDPGLYLEAVRQGVVLYHADEAVLGENPHSGNLHWVVIGWGLG